MQWPRPPFSIREHPLPLVLLSSSFDSSSDMHGWRTTMRKMKRIRRRRLNGRGPGRYDLSVLSPTTLPTLPRVLQLYKRVRLLRRRSSSRQRLHHNSRVLLNLYPHSPLQGRSTHFPSRTFSTGSTGSASSCPMTTPRSEPFSHFCDRKPLLTPSATSGTSAASAASSGSWEDAANVSDDSR